MNATVLTLHDPLGICKKEHEAIDEGTLLLSWLIDKYGPEGFTTPTEIFSGSVSKADKIDLNDHIDTGYPVGEGESIFIIHSPTGFDPFTLFVIFVIIAVAAFVFIPTPAIPSVPEIGSAQESPNNKLTGQTNIARPLERIPDIFGKMKVYPDLIAKSYTEFIAHIKYVTEYLCIGRGEYLVEELRSGDTLISDITGAEATVFGPSTAPSELLDVEESNEVNGQEIYGPNDTGSFDIVDADTIFFHSASLDRFFSQDSQFAQFEQFNIGDQFTISGSVSNNGVFTFDGYNLTASSGTHRIEVLETITIEVATIDVTSVAGRKSEIGPFTVPGNPDEIWVDIVCPRGLQDANDTLAIDLDIHVQEIDGGGSPVGAVQTTSITLTDNTLDPRFYTFKIIPNNPGNLHEVSIERLTNTSDVNDYFDQTKWTRLAGVEDVTVSDFGNVTTVLIITKATEQATSAQRREFNAIVTRKLRTYNTTTDTVTVPLLATARMADAALEILTDSFMGNKPVDELDLDTLYEIQERLEVDAIYGDKLVRFCYSFSNSNTPVGDELATCLNAARCFAFREGRNVSFRRDEEQTTRTMLFNQRNKSPDDEVKTTQYYRPNDIDSVELQWTDEDTGEASIVTMPEPSGGSHAKKVDGAGIRNYEQAWNRANYEYLRLLHQRTGVEATVTKDGLLLDPNDRIGNLDGTNITAQGGEVIGVDTLTIETSEIVDFGVEADGYVILRDEEGEPSVPLLVTPRFDDVNGFILDSAPPFTILIRGDNGNQIGTLYTFFEGASTNHEANDYLVKEISPGNDNYVKLQLVNYAPEIYGPDTETPTAET